MQDLQNFGCLMLQREKTGLNMGARQVKGIQRLDQP
jgi:hypothetical protein